jgi:hypothetical protein
VSLFFPGGYGVATSIPPTAISSIRSAASEKKKKKKKKKKIDRIWIDRAYKKDSILPHKNAGSIIIHLHTHLFSFKRSVFADHPRVSIAKSADMVHKFLVIIQWQRR